MFECLVGHTPFQSRNPIRMILDHLEKPAPIVTESTTNFVPKGLSDIVSQCLQKNRHDRFKTVADIKRELLACRQWLPVTEIDKNPPAPRSKKHVDYDGETMIHLYKSDETTMAIQAKLQVAQKITGKRPHHGDDSNKENDFPLLLPEPNPEQEQNKEQHSPTGVAAKVLLVALLCGVLAFSATWLELGREHANPSTTPVPTVPIRPPSLGTWDVLTEENPAAAPRAVFNLAQAYMKENRYDLALPLLYFCSISEKDLGHSPLRADIESALGLCYEKDGQLIKAYRSFKLATDIYQVWLPSTSIKLEQAKRDVQRVVNEKNP